MHSQRHFSTPVFVLLIFALAFTLRLCFALQWQAMPYGASPQLDAEIYDQWAWKLAQGTDHTGVFYQSSFYPYLLSLLYRVVGHSLAAAGILNAFWDSLTVVMLGLIARSLFGNAAAIITGILAALYAPMIFYAAPPMKESVALLLLALFLYTALHALRGVRLYSYALCGLFLGLAIMARGNALLLAPLVPLFAWLRYGRSASAAVTLFGLGIVIALTPSTLHNWRAAHDFVPIAYDDGFNLYIGHAPTANGTNSYPPEVSTGPDQERIDVTWSAEQSAGHALKPSQVSAFWRDKAINYALTHPVREAELLGRKFLAFWNNEDRFDNYDPVFIRQNFPSVLNLLAINFSVVAALAAFAAVCAWPMKKRAADDRFFLIICAITYMCSVLIFYVTDRYRLPMLVFLLPLAGAAIPCAVTAFSGKAYKKLACAGCGAGLVLVIALLPPLDPVDNTAFDWGALTTIYADQGHDDDALDAFHKALAISPQGAGLQAYIRAAGIYEQRGQIDEAQKWVETAVKLFPDDGVALYNLGRMQALRGDIDAALATMQRAQALDPTYGLTYFALAKLYDKKGDTQHAHEAIEKGLSINPADTRLLALLAAAKGDEIK